MPFKLRERSIFRGYEVLRKIGDAKGGWIAGERDSRTTIYKAAQWAQHESAFICGCGRILEL